MLMYDLIQKKQRGGALDDAELEYFVRGVTSGEIPDYQTAALLMAVYFTGMTDAETAALTRYMARSGEQEALLGIEGTTVDKHSTGGVGDKTTLVLAPVAAACGLTMAKMSGRGLGHTGGTVDKLESIPGFKTSLARSEFVAIANRVGACLIGQTDTLAPADKKLYALRDVTATVQSLPLIASSIMSKKLSSGSSCILLDVKTGSGAFMKTQGEAVELARLMIAIGESEGRRTMALVTDMDTPLGANIGNSLEVIEAAEVLKGAGPADLREICLKLSAVMINLARHGRGIGLDKCEEEAVRALESGAAYRKFLEMVEAQGGDASVIEDYSRFPKAGVKTGVKAEAGGYIAHMDSEAIGRSAVLLGAGRAVKDEPVDHAAGVVLKRKTGDFVRKGEEIAEFRSESRERCDEAARLFLQAVSFSQSPVKARPHILACIGRDGKNVPL